MRRADIWAVVPVKETAAAKQRLAPFVPEYLRAALALAMFEDVLDALARVTELAGIVVVTADAAATTLATRYGARIFADHARGGHTAVVAATAHALACEGRGGMLQLPGDIPLVSPSEVSRLLKSHLSPPAFTIAPSHDDRGSNAVLVSPPEAVPLSFGDDSFHPHLRTARRYGIEPNIVRLPGIALDIDHPEDIAAFSRLRSRTRTQRFLDNHGLSEGRELRANAGAEL